MDPISVQPLHQTVADRIRDKIRRGELTVGQKIVETRLCAALGVSRTPLREALRVLSSEGLIDLIPNRGAFVTQPTMDEVRNMFAVMSVLEGTCARMAVERLTPQRLSRLKALHDELERHYAARDPEAYIVANNAYHTALQEMTGNHTLNDILNGLRQKVLLYRFRQLYEPDRFDQSIREHRALIQALRDRNADAAERLMRDHLLRQCEALVHVYEREESAETARR